MNFLGSNSSLGNSSSAFLDLLIEKHPEVEINFSVTYEVFLNFSIDIFLKKHQKKSRATINQVVFATDYGKITSTKAFIDQQSPQEVQLKDECKFRGTELCSEFVNILFKNTTQKTYMNAMTIKKVLAEKLQDKLCDLIAIICDRNEAAWYQNLLIESPTPADVREFKEFLEQWEAIVQADEQKGLDNLKISDRIQDFVKQILRTRKLVNEIVRMLVFLTNN